MCLTIASELLTAKADIQVVKVLQHDNLSPYYGLEYQPNTLYRLRKPLASDSHIINKGFHSFDISRVEFRNDSYMVHIIFQNLDGYLEVADRFDLYENKFCAFTIPKGAKYYMGRLRDITASLKRLKKIKVIVD